MSVYWLISTVDKICTGKICICNKLTSRCHKEFISKVCVLTWREHIKSCWILFTQHKYLKHRYRKYEGVSKSFRTGRLERKLQMVQLSATRRSCIAILWVSLVYFAAIFLCVASHRVIPKVRVYFFIDSVRKRLDTSSYIFYAYK
jgi:hypothetical protein